MKELPLKNDIFCVYNGEESEVPLLFLCGKPTGNSKGLPLKEKERMIKRKARVIHEKIHEERAAGNGNLQLLRKETDCRQGDYLSEKDGEIHRFDLCESCYDQMRAQFTIDVEVEEQVELL